MDTETFVPKALIVIGESERTVDIKHDGTLLIDSCPVFALYLPGFEKAWVGWTTIVSQGICQVHSHNYLLAVTIASPLNRIDCYRL
jgi:hypothetical protein